MSLLQATIQGSIGWFGIPGGPEHRSTKTHYVHENKIVCGVKMSPLQQFQWCSPASMGHRPECERCKKIIDRLWAEVAAISKKDAPMRGFPIPDVKLTAPQHKRLTDIVEAAVAGRKRMYNGLLLKLLSNLKAKGLVDFDLAIAGFADSKTYFRIAPWPTKKGLLAVGRDNLRADQIEHATKPRSIVEEDWKLR